LIALFLKGRRKGRTRDRKIQKEAEIKENK
jgi:hypothetical protein